MLKRNLFDVLFLFLFREFNTDFRVCWETFMCDFNVSLCGIIHVFLEKCILSISRNLK